MALWVQRFEGSATTTHATCNPAHHELDPSSGDLINCLLCVDMQERKNSDRTLHDSDSVWPRTIKKMQEIDASNTF